MKIKLNKSQTGLFKFRAVIANGWIEIVVHDKRRCVVFFLLSTCASFSKVRDWMLLLCIGRKQAVCLMRACTGNNVKWRHAILEIRKRSKGFIAYKLKSFLYMWIGKRVIWARVRFPMVKIIECVAYFWLRFRRTKFDSMSSACVCTSIYRIQ